jgi:hypothetical protein
MLAPEQHSLRHLVSRDPDGYEVLGSGTTDWMCDLWLNAVSHDNPKGNWLAFVAREVRHFTLPLLLPCRCGQIFEI